MVQTKKIKLSSTIDQVEPSKQAVKEGDEIQMKENQSINVEENFENGNLNQNENTSNDNKTTEPVEDDDTESEEDSESEEEDDDDFMANLTEEQKKIIEERQKALQKQYTSFVKKQTKTKLQELMEATSVSMEEAKIALECCNNDESEAANRLSDPDFRDYLTDIIDEQKHYREIGSTTKISVTINEYGMPVRKESRGPRSKSAPRNPNVVSGFNMNGEKRAKSLRLTDALEQLAKIKREKKKQGQASSSGDESNNSEQETEAKMEADQTDSTNESDAGGSSKEEEVQSSGEITGNASNETTKKPDDVEYSYEDLKSLEWSEARIKAFINRKNNPNAYYYRFNAPGEPQATGQWAEDEHKLFMDLIKDGVDYRWGILSMEIPGRVGYQCSNYYRKLVQDGKINDPNYTVGADGKLKFTRPKDFKVERVKGSAKTSSAAARLREKINPKRKPKKSKKRKKRKAGDEYMYADDIDSDTDGEGLDAETVRPEDEVIPGLRCPMTCAPMADPAISPGGYVMSYKNWVRVLLRNPKNTCPFTKAKVTRRQLIKLTKENKDQYMDKIKNKSNK